MVSKEVAQEMDKGNTAARERDGSRTVDSVRETALPKRDGHLQRRTGDAHVASCPPTAHAFSPSADAAATDSQLEPV